MRFRFSRVATTAPATASATGTPDSTPKLTIVLVHRAWADSSSWNPVIERLRRDGFPVRAIADPLQGLTSDTAYVTSYLSTIDGPKVLVGHSYGGAVIITAVPGGAEVTIDPAQFRAAFAGDLDRTVAADRATTQRPANTKAVTDASVTEGFRTIPSWALLTRQDHAVSPDLQRFMDTRAGARITEVDASHAVMLSRPDVVTKLVEQAAR